MKVVILGGGIAGLAAAIALAERGHVVEVFERRSSVHSLGAGIVCWPNACFVLESLGILEQLKQVGGVVSAMRRISNDGEPLGELDIGRINAAMGYESYSVLRADFMHILSRKASDLAVGVHCDMNAVEIIPTGENCSRVRFEGGRVEEADLILGAEGRMNSIARQYVLGNAQPVFQGIVNWLGVYESKKPKFSDMAILDFWGVGARFGIVPLSERKAYWAGGFVAEQTDQDERQHDLSELEETFSNWPVAVREVVAQAKECNAKRFCLYDHDPVQEWHRDNVLLVGDAAHAALPTSGQGAGQALEDAWTLARVLDSPAKLGGSMEEFTRLRCRKTAGIALGAREFARSLFQRDPQACAERNANSQQLDFARMAQGMAHAWSAGLPLGN